MRTRVNISLLIIAIFCIAPAKQETTVRMVRKAAAIPSAIMPLLVEEPPSSGLYTLRPIELNDPSARTNWAIVIATNSNGSPLRTFSTDTNIFGVSNLDYRATYYLRGAIGATGQISVTLAWDASASPETAGYRIYTGTNSRVYDRMVDVGNSATGRVDALDAQANHFFAVTAYNSIGIEGGYSDGTEVGYTAPGGGTITFRLAGTTNAFTNEFKWPVVVEKYVKPMLDYYSASQGIWVSNYASRIYTNLSGNQFWRYRCGDKTNSPNRNNRAWQAAASLNGPWFDLPDTLVQNTNAGPIKFSIIKWSNIDLSRYQIPE